LLRLLIWFQKGNVKPSGARLKPRVTNENVYFTPAHRSELVLEGGTASTAGALSGFHGHRQSLRLSTRASLHDDKAEYIENIFRKEFIRDLKL
jgi:hypothetical protein